jgi:hypothetical protein
VLAYLCAHEDAATARRQWRRDHQTIQRAKLAGAPFTFIFGFRLRLRSTVQIEKEIVIDRSD